MSWLTREARDWIAEGLDLEEVVARLRERGCSIYQCAPVIHSLTGWSIDRVKAFLDDSPTWAEVRESNRRLHTEIFDALVDTDDL
jgi:hypothetical protein